MQTLVTVKMRFQSLAGSPQREGAATNGATSLCCPSIWTSPAVATDWELDTTDFRREGQDLRLPLLHALSNRASPVNVASKIASPMRSCRTRSWESRPDP
jgi:hypothetical protein